MNPPDSYDPSECEFPFPISGTRLETCRKEVARLRALHSSVFRIAEQIAGDMIDAQRSARAEIGWTIQRSYLQPLDKLDAADRQAIAEGGGFLLPEEREIVRERLQHTDAIVRGWEDEAARAADAALLTKYATALDAYVPNVAVGGKFDEHGHCDEPEFDYSAVITAARAVNPPPQEVAA